MSATTSDDEFDDALSLLDTGDDDDDRSSSRSSGKGGSSSPEKNRNVMVAVLLSQLEASRAALRDCDRANIDARDTYERQLRALETTLKCRDELIAELADQLVSSEGMTVAPFAPAAPAAPATTTSLTASTPGPPPEFICPITYDMFVDPVVAADGFTYERGAIVQWLSSHNTSPLTGARLPTMLLLQNTTLRKLVDEWRGERGLRTANRFDAPAVEVGADGAVQPLRAGSASSTVMMTSPPNRSHLFHTPAARREARPAWVDPPRERERGNGDAAAIAGPPQRGVPARSNICGIL